MFDFTINQQELISLLESAQPICTRKTTVDITESILFSLSPRELIIKATDLEVSLQLSTVIDSPMIDSCQFLVSGKRLYDVVKELEGEISCTYTGSSLNIHTEHGVKLSLAVKDAHDFPPFPERIENLMQVDAEKLLSLMNKVVFVIPHNNANPALNGMLLECDAMGMSMVATDGHCLAKASTHAITSNEAHSWLLPKRSVLELKKVLEINKTPSVFIGTCNGYVVFSGANFNFFTRLVAFPFPQYKAILDKSDFFPTTIAKDQLTRSLKRAGCLLAGQFIAAHFDFDSQVINMKVDNKEVGTLKETIPLKTMNETILSVKFYTPYLLNGLQAITEKDVIFYMKSNTKPLMFESADKEKEITYTYLVMPVFSQQA